MDSTSNETLSDRDIFYFRQRYQNRVFQTVISFFAEKAEQEGLTKKELASRLSRDPAQITRWFSGPGNWTLDTVSDLLLAMDAEMSAEVQSFNGVIQVSTSSNAATFVDVDPVNASNVNRASSTPGFKMFAVK